MSSKILAIVAHADDEVLGCGGTLKCHTTAGDSVHLAVLADGITSRDASYQPEMRIREIKVRENAARRAAKILGLQEPSFFRFPDNRCDQVATLDLAKVVERLVAEVQPRTVYTHHAWDLNVDHQRVHQAVLTACRPLPGASVRNIYSFEVLSSTEWNFDEQSGGFRPQRFVDIAHVFEAKLRALAAYECEMRHFPHPRSHDAVTALAKLRGSTAGLTAAEAFMVIREIV